VSKGHHCYVIRLSQTDRDLLIFCKTQFANVQIIRRHQTTYFPRATGGRRDNVGRC
jgi:hypothetical protein